MQLDAIIRTDCTVMAFAPLADDELPVIDPVEPEAVEPEPVVPLPLVVEPVEPGPVVPDPVEPDVEPLPMELPDELLLIVPRISTWWPTCFWRSDVLPVRRYVVPPMLPLEPMLDPLPDVPDVPLVLPGVPDAVLPLMLPLPDVPDAVLPLPDVPDVLLPLPEPLPMRALVRMKPPLPEDAEPLAAVPDPEVVPLVEPEPEVPVLPLMLPEPLALARQPTTVTVFPLCEALDGAVPDEVCAARLAALAIATAPMLANSRVMVLSP